MLNRRLPLIRQAAATVLTLALAFGPPLATRAAAQEGRGSIRGVLYEPDGKSELAGGKVTAVNVKTGKQYPSNVTGSNGSYEINGLPAGSYDIVIESGGLLFVADNLVDLEEGRSVPVDYAVEPHKPPTRIVRGLPAPRGAASEVGGSEQPVAARSFWRSRNGILLLSVLGVGAGVAIAGGGNDNNASPSTP